MAAPAHVGKRILIIDDDMSTLELMSTILGCEGYRVAAARNGLDGIDRLHTYEKPDLILLDLKMPGMDGQGFCQARRKDQGWATIPLVVLSAAEDVAAQASKLAAVAYLRKPVDTLKLLTLVRQHCGKPAAADAPANG